MILSNERKEFFSNVIIFLNLIRKYYFLFNVTNPTSMIGIIILADYIASGNNYNSEMGPSP